MEKILIVDDEVEITEIIGEILCGDYDIFTQTDSVTANRILQEENFDVLITDWIMPNVNGGTLVATAKKFNPKIKTIIVTGSHGHLDVADATLAKPFTMADITKTVSRLLQ